MVLPLRSLTRRSGTIFAPLIFFLSIRSVDSFSLHDISQVVVGFVDILFDLGFVIPQPFLLFPELDCKRRVLLSGFDIYNYDRYDRFFRDDSVMTLAPAGEYKGVQGIKEYVQFSDPSTNDLLIDPEQSYIIDEELVFLGYEDGQCIFQNNLFQHNVFTEAGSGGTNQRAGSLKLVFDYNRRYIPKIYVYFPDPYTTYFFDSATNTEQTREFICSVLANGCKGIAAAPDNCADQVATLPATTDGGYADGNSQGCRLIHSFIARSQPELHCPHVSLTPMEDPNGQIKCQTSQKLQYSDLFNAEDIATFNAFAERNGVDPAIGYVVLSQGGGS